MALALWFPLAVLCPGGLDVVPWLLALVLMLGVVRRLGARPAARRLARVAEDGALGVLLGTLLAGAPTAVGAPARRVPSSTPSAPSSATRARRRAAGRAPSRRTTPSMRTRASSHGTTSRPPGHRTARGNHSASANRVPATAPRTVSYTHLRAHET